MATKSKTSRGPSKKPPQRISKVMLEVLWRPPKVLVAIVAASLAFSIVGYTALHLSDALTPEKPSGSSATAETALKIMPLGDSVTAGSIANSPDSYRLSLWRKLVSQDGMPIDFVGSQHEGSGTLPDKDHEGHTGWRTDQLNENVTMWLATEKPDIILLQTGASDLLQGATAAEAISRLNLLLTTISTNSELTVYVASLNPLGSQGDWNRQAWRDYNAAIPKIVDDFNARGMRIEFVDLNERGAHVGEQDMTNDAYPTTSGYEKIAGAWYDVVRTHPTGRQ